MTQLRHPIQFHSVTPKHYADVLRQQLEQTQQVIENITADSMSTYETVCGTLDEALSELQNIFHIGQHLEGIVGGPDWRAAMSKLRPAVTHLLTSVPLNAKLHQKLKQVETNNATLPPLQRRHLELTLDTFRQGGALLDPKDQETLREVELRLSEMTSKFAQNAIDATEAIAIECPVMDLSGLPEGLISDAIERAKSVGKTGAIIAGDAVNVMNTLRFAHSRTLRQKVWSAHSSRASRGPLNNRPIIKEILNLRQTKAALLGYENIIALTLLRRMAENEETAFLFLNNLVEACKRQSNEEHRALVEFARQENIIGDNQPLAPWDISYAAERLRQKDCNFNDEDLKPYAALPQLIDGLFTLAKRLFGIDIKPLEEAPTWHDDVLCYGIYDGAEMLGCCYFDLHPRAGKRGGAWMYPLRHRDKQGGVAVGVVAANVTKGPTLSSTCLNHREVQTLFHEFGHLLHHMLSEVSIGSMSGVNVAWDFVELPSQLLENWVWCENGLRTLLRHKDSGEPPPQSVIERLIATRRFRSASGLTRQLSFAILDLELHRLGPKEDPVSTALSIARQFSPVDLPDSYSMVTSFGHLFSSPVGYAAGYYSYLWAQMLEADVFDRFTTDGIFEREVGQKFRKSILSVGNSVTAMDAFVSFMGRAPEDEALLKRYGLSKEASA
ncbi:MAG: M3 family metallopeptidase [Bradymonadia bacterium]